MLAELASLADADYSPWVRDAIRIWSAGVSAVTPGALFERKVRREGRWLIIDDHCSIDLARTRRLIVVGGGKASAAMATALYQRLLDSTSTGPLPEVVGWINAPQGSFSQPPSGIHLHAARPAGENLPTQAAVDGTRRILELVAGAGPDDVVLCLISGGGSALLVAPPAGLRLADKQAVAHRIGAAGGSIRQLNEVRRCLSRVKGGGLARACRAGRLVSLLISDVLGDPLDVIASGPTVLETLPSSARALAVLEELNLTEHPELAAVVAWLRGPGAGSTAPVRGCSVEHVVLGNNADAIDAAGVKAVELGYRYLLQPALTEEGDVWEVATRATATIRQMMRQPQMDCWITGGEPTVRVPAEGGGKGGRNQQLALCVLEQLCRQGWPANEATDRLVFLSGGTDGEDGPTDAAGAWFDAATVHRLRAQGCDPTAYRARADAYNFFQQVGGLLRTGPTGTNVCDLRVALRPELDSGGVP